MYVRVQDREMTIFKENQKGLLQSLHFFQKEEGGKESDTTNHTDTVISDCLQKKMNIE